ncbi:CUB and sushi domain-containing protein 1-like [Mya arenaria]|uniref:CUB and sushi domain-containing protein 1-like n=1 Tax=Mya arenaria TaxID=6604 RepID=UPI0022E95ED6|nr:CUB and sushi domain-containing protein 1-like [Mya arenaria]
MKLKRGYLLSFISLFGNCFCAGNFEGRNVALGKKPGQGPRSSANGEAQLTVDGNISTAAGACAHTQANTPYRRPWWRLNFDQSRWISGIKIFNIKPKWTIIRPNCIKGFSLARGVNRTCQKDGQFSGGNPQCTVVTCSPFGKLENGTLHYTDEQNMNQYVDENKHHTFGVKVRASCDSGFQLVNGSKEQICLEDGTWDGVKPVCGKIRCNDTSLLSLRFQQSSSVFSFLEQGTASYNSSKFYHMNGSLSFICRANGSLSWESQPQELGN